MSKATQESVMDRLRNLSSIDKARELFSELNYSPAEDPLPRRDWKADLRETLLEDPMVLAASGDFHVIYSRLADQRLLRTAQRPIVERLLRDHPYALFLFSTRDRDRWHFLNVKVAARNGDADDENRKPERRRFFRRITVGPEERYGNRLRTAAERLAMLDLETIAPDLFGIPPLTIQQRHDDAFDVEVVQKKFFEKFKALYDVVAKDLRKDTAHKKSADEDALLLLNRLLFLYFVQRKGWLAQKQDFLVAKFAPHRAKPDHCTYYREFLLPLFERLSMREYLDDRFDKVPFLNGGLFDIDATATGHHLKVTNRTFARVFDDLLERYNFTVTEDTPLDVEVAVDPEMLGKVFEELITERHDSGSYYTPRPIVSFMCREALKGYLGGPPELVDHHDAGSVTVPQARAALEKLQRVRVVDPACGSGAYLLGMLHELHELTRVLDTRVQQADSRDDYQRKLQVIQNNLYGVDIQPTAVHIAKLRLWLSLAVEYDGAKPDPLPNLEFKIGLGNSLSAAGPGFDSIEDVFRHETIERFRRLKEQFGRTDSSTLKSRLRQQILEIRRELAESAHPGEEAEGFDWAVEFAEVFEADGRPPGFDVVLTNPPFVRQELIKDQKPRLKEVFPEVFCGTADLYCFFYARALQLLAEGGMLVFISPNKWFKANYGAKLRAHIAATCQVRNITDFGELPVFERAATFPMILVAQKSKPKEGRAPVQKPRFTQVKNLDPPYPDVLQIMSESGMDLPPQAINGANWTLTDAASIARIEKMQRAGVPLERYVNGQIYYGIKTGYNMAFVIDGAKRAELIAKDRRSAEIIKPLAVGDDIRKWRIEKKDRWLIVTPVGIRMQDYPAVLQHLKKWKEDLEARWDKGNHWWELRPCDYYSALKGPKIVFPDIAKESRFAFDRSGCFVINTTYLIPVDDLFLLGVLNSASAWGLCKSWLTVMGDAEKRGRLRFFTQFVNQIPIPTATKAQRDPIAALVQKCIDARGQECEKWEREIDDRVARLYGLR